MKRSATTADPAREPVRAGMAPGVRLDASSSRAQAATASRAARSRSSRKRVARAEHADVQREVHVEVRREEAPEHVVHRQGAARDAVHRVVGEVVARVLRHDAGVRAALRDEELRELPRRSVDGSQPRPVEVDGAHEGVAAVTRPSQDRGAAPYPRGRRRARAQSASHGGVKSSAQTPSGRSSLGTSSAAKKPVAAAAQ